MYINVEFRRFRFGLNDNVKYIKILILSIILQMPFMSRRNYIILNQFLKYFLIQKLIKKNHFKIFYLM